MKKKHSRRGKIALALLIAPFLLFALLQSPLGKAWLGRSLSKQLSRPESIEVSIGKISGMIPSDMRVASVEIRDDGGLWLKAEGLHCRWVMKALFSGLIKVERLGAERIELTRLPTPGPEPRPPREFKGFKPLDIDLGGFDIKELRLGAAVAGTPLKYAVHAGGIRLRSTGECSGALSVSGDATGQVDVSAPPAGTEDYLFKATAELRELCKLDMGLPGLSGRAEATVSASGAAITLEASAEDYEFGMDARVARKKGLWGVEFERLAVLWMDRVSVEVAGDLWPDFIALQGSLAELDIETLPIAGISNVTGRLSGQFSLTGSLAEPEVEASLDVMDLTTTQMALDELPHLNLHVDAWQRNGRFHGEITNAVSGSLQASADVPCVLSLQPFLFELNPDACKASLTANLNLELLNRMTALKEQRVRGRLGANLVFDGLSEEKLAGCLILESGGYEYASAALSELSGRADVKVSDSGAAITLGASAEGAEFKMDARVAQSNGLWGVELEQLAVRWQDAVDFELAGGVWPDSIQLEGKLSEFDIGKLPIAAISNYTGHLSGQVALTGSLAVPEVEASLEVTDLSTAQMGLEELPHLNLHAAVSQRNGRLHGETRMTNAVSGSLQAVVDAPCEFSLQPFLFELHPDACKASLNADLNLAILNGIATLSDQNIRGQLGANLVLNGTPEEKLDGHITLENGFYEHYAWGVVVRDIHADWEASDKGLLVKQMTANDGGSGRITVGGGIGLSESGLPLDLQIMIEKAHLIHREEVDAVLSANLHVGSLLSNPSLEGKLVIDRADILLDNIAPPGPGLLTDFDASAVTNEAEVAAVKKEPPFTMDVAVLMPDQIFVNSAVIDSVWGGTLKLKSGAEGMTVAGMIRPRRGFVEFVGKKFRMKNEGGIRLNAADPASSSINIKAEYARSEITAELGLVGKLSNPKYTLTSTPAMPEDEILSYVLFGQDTSSVSPYQAYQIAMAAKQLAGGMSGPGFIYKVRRAVGIDTLEWNEPETEDEKSTLVAGKYVGTGLYLEVNSTFEDEEDSTGVMAEYEITPHFSVETSTGPQMRPGIGVNWKNDY
ncbi:translocation/assembly module TamB domain-containing protein [Pontiella sulfatireligans]|uniref:Translocation and assembly module TamB C-terminal domain-containing protein n=1 Tax=Pontiella sulfatireligans TaxID=2750658 RepID=A0A6C2UHW6_9BACT|nr:translocation/assembly module TamB domain-containing protein [Pontiella sulfatireligans]VGO19812.1 hypothetical protein SCARR_01872 [Pontiella sulfatireligans]